MVRETKAGQRFRQVVQERTRALLDSGDVARHDEAGNEYFYRPNHLVVAQEFLPALSEGLRRLGAGQPEHEESLGVARVPLPAGSDVNRAVLELRKASQLGPEAVGPHHVLFGAPIWHGSPGRPPFPAKPIVVGEGKPAGEGVLVAVIDTGQAESALGGAWESAHLRVDAADIDRLDVDGDGVLDFEAGHGTFISGIIAQVAPGADVLMIAAISPSGVTDDLTVARALVRARGAGAAIVNLSLGGYAESDAVPLGLAAALRNDKDGCVVVVAAAGNDGASRPFYPAALPGVIAVAALNSSGRRAGFSNFGPWVDAAADGDRLVSTFVTGKVMTDSDGDGQADVFGMPYAYWSGTSFAAPQVSAAIAARMSATGQSAADAAHGLIHDPSLSRRPGLGTTIVTSVRSHSAGPGHP